MEIFSERLKALRLEHNLTLSDLAKALNVSVIAVSRWENKQKTPNIETLKDIALYFSVSSNYLIGIES